MHSAKQWARSWASGMGQWARWVTGEGPTPDKRSKRILGGTAGGLVGLIALFTLVGGGGNAGTGARHGAPAAHYYPLTQSGAHPAPANPWVAAIAAAMATTTTTTTTTAAKAGASGSGTKSSHPHTRRNGTRRHPKSTANGSSG